MSIYTSISANQSEIFNAEWNEAQKFLAALFQPDDAVLLRFIEVWQEGTDRKSKVHKTKYRLVRDLDDRHLHLMSEYAAATGSNQFFGVCPRLSDEGGFDLACQIRLVRVLWSDLDRCTPEEGEGRCRQGGLPPPSVVVQSGHGVHLYWLLDKPVHIDDAYPEPISKRFELVRGKWRAVYYRLQGEAQEEVPIRPRKLLSPKALEVQAVLRGVAQRVGGDHTQDLARLLRLPGSLNRKNERNGQAPMPCRLVGCDPSRRYPFSAFAGFKQETAGPRPTAPREKAGPLPPSGGREFTAWGDLPPQCRDELDRLLAGCDNPEDGDRSRADFKLCCEAVECGVSPDDVWEKVQGVGKFAERGPDYFEDTWAKAQSRVEHQFDGIKDFIEEIRAKERQGRGSAVPAPPGSSGNVAPASGQGGGRALPEIISNGRQLREITQDALDAIAGANQPPRLFQDGGTLNRLRTELALPNLNAAKYRVSVEELPGDGLQAPADAAAPGTPVETAPPLPGSPADQIRRQVRQAQRAGERAYRFEPLSSADFAAASYPIEWLVRGLVVARQPLIFGGPKKSMKTNVSIDLALSLGTGAPFLGRFPTKKTACALISGESGEFTVQETARRICQAKGVDLAEAGVWWDFRLPSLSQEEELDELAAGLAKHQIRVAIVDPIYLCLLSGAGKDKNAANLFDMGPLLGSISRACLDAGCTPILAHHARKNINNPWQPLDLEDLAFAGIQEFARQWLLVSRREAYTPGSGVHQLWLSCGGSVGHSGLWGLNIDEGTLHEDFTGRKWEPTILNLDQIKEQEQQRKTDKKISAEQSEDTLLRDRLRTGARTKTELRAALGWGAEKVNRVCHRLLHAGRVVETSKIVKAGKGSQHEYPAIGLPEDAPSEKADGASGHPDGASGDDT